MDNTLAAFSNNYLKQLRANAEATIAKRTSSSPVMTEKDVLIEELKIHRIELEMQNESFREAQHSLALVNNRYVKTLEHSPVGHLTLNKSGIIINANLAATKFLGQNQNYVLQSPLTKYMTPQSADMHYLKMLDMLQTNTDQHYEVEITTIDGSIRNMQMHLQTVPINGRNEIQVTILDFIGTLQKSASFCARVK